MLPSLQVPSSLMDMSVLLACQALLQQVSEEGSASLLSQLYKHLLFDFRIWSNGHFAVRLGTPPSPSSQPPRRTLESQRTSFHYML